MILFPYYFDFLQPFCEETGLLVPDPSDAGAILTMNQNRGDGLERVAEAKALADKVGIPFCYWTIEDPNSYAFTIHQARLADYVFTSDGALIQRYRRDLGHERVYWLPLAASEEYHHPLPLAEDAADFVLSCNWYDYWNDGRPRNNARIWGTETVILPLARAGYSMVIYSYSPPPYPELKPFWRDDGGGCRNVAEQYTHGRVVLGQNNQRSDMDGIERTLMTSMRTFEALACGKPFLTPESDAYEALGFRCTEHMIWSDVTTATYVQAGYMRGGIAYGEEASDAMGQRGRAFVLANHTYRHRLERIGRAIQGEADPEAWQ
jgi:spore maturation protein CgeB